MGEQALTAGDVSQGLSAWLGARFPETAVALDDAALDHVSAGGVVRLALQAITPDIGDTRKAALRLLYRVSVESADPLVRHRLISEIAFALLFAPVLPLGEANCALELVPAQGGDLALTLSTRLSRQRAGSDAQPVTHPLILKSTEVGRIAGRISAGDGSPVSGATVEIPSLALRAVSTADGSFHIDGIPADGAVLQIVARKRQARASATAKVGSEITMQLSVKD